MHQDLAGLDREIERRSPVSDAISGALMGLAIGYFVHRKEKGHRELLRHAGYGAAIGFGLGYVSKGALSLASGFGHRVENAWSKEYVGAPATPVVTKGYFTGSPRALHHAYDPNDPRARGRHHHPSQHHAGYAVGAPPPGGDYSFTRRPGYNGKDY